jgi:hypothetical protein
LRIRTGGLRGDCVCQHYVSHVTRHTSHVTRHTSHVTLHTSNVTRHTSHVTRHTSHVTHHTSHVTRHTSHVTRHTSHVTRRQVCTYVGHRSHVLCCSFHYWLYTGDIWLHFSEPRHFIGYVTFDAQQAPTTGLSKNGTYLVDSVRKNLSLPSFPL